MLRNSLLWKIVEKAVTPSDRRRSRKKELECSKIYFPSIHLEANKVWRGWCWRKGPIASLSHSSRLGTLPPPDSSRDEKKERVSKFVSYLQLMCRPISSCAGGGGGGDARLGLTHADAQIRHITPATADYDGGCHSVRVDLCLWKCCRCAVRKWVLS